MRSVRNEDSAACWLPFDHPSLPGEAINIFSSRRRESGGHSLVARLEQKLIGGFNTQKHTALSVWRETPLCRRLGFVHIVGASSA